MENVNKMSPESLHDIANSTAKAVSDKFVNPGTPAGPFVARKDMPKATLSGGTEELRKQIIK